MSTDKEMPVRIHHGGLFRCCVQTAFDHGHGEEGEKIDCSYCVTGRLIFTDGAWGWDKDESQEKRGPQPPPVARSRQEQ